MRIVHITSKLDRGSACPLCECHETRRTLFGSECANCGVPVTEFVTDASIVTGQRKKCLDETHLGWRAERQAEAESGRRCSSW